MSRPIHLLRDHAEIMKWDAPVTVASTAFGTRIALERAEGAKLPRQGMAARRFVAAL